MTIMQSVQRVTETILTGTEEHLRHGDGVVPPTVWVFDPRLDPPLLGSAVARPYAAGTDAVRAIARLGAFPAAFGSPLIMVSWEQADLFAALEIDDDVPTAIMTVLADIDGRHQITMHPGEFYPLGCTPSGAQRFGVRWGPELDFRDAELPGPIEALLATWQRDSRDASAATAGRVGTELKNEGYQLSLTRVAA